MGPVTNAPPSELLTQGREDAKLRLPEHLPRPEPTYTEQPAKSSCHAATCFVWNAVIQTSILQIIVLTSVEKHRQEICTAMRLPGLREKATPSKNLLRWQLRNPGDSSGTPLPSGSISVTYSAACTNRAATIQEYEKSTEKRLEVRRYEALENAVSQGCNLRNSGPQVSHATTSCRPRTYEIPWRHSVSRHHGIAKHSQCSFGSDCATAHAISLGLPAWQQANFLCYTLLEWYSLDREPYHSTLSASTEFSTWVTATCSNNTAWRFGLLSAARHDQDSTFNANELRRGLTLPTHAVQLMIFLADWL